MANANSTRLAFGEGITSDPRSKCETVKRKGWWKSEPDVDRVAHGVPSRVDRLKCLGNAVVPQVVEMIGHAIMDMEREE